MPTVSGAPGSSEAHTEAKTLIEALPAGTYTPTNVTADRAFDANAVVVAELADVVGTLIADLQAAGILD